MQQEIIDFLRDTQLMWGLIVIALSLLISLFFFAAKSKKLIVPNRKKLEKIIQRMQKKLEEKDKKLYDLALNKTKPEKIAKELNINKSDVEQRMGEIIDILRK